VICNACGHDKAPDQFTRCGKGKRRRVCRACESHAKRSRRYGIGTEEYFARYIAAWPASSAARPPARTGQSCLPRSLPPALAAESPTTLDRVCAAESPGLVSGNSPPCWADQPVVGRVPPHHRHASPVPLARCASPSIGTLLSAAPPPSYCGPPSIESPLRDALSMLNILLSLRLHRSMDRPRDGRSSTAYDYSWMAQNFRN